MRLLAQDYDVAFLLAGNQADDQSLMVRPAACLACAPWGDQAHRGASRRAMRFDRTCRPLPFGATAVHGLLHGVVCRMDRCWHEHLPR